MRSGASPTDWEGIGCPSQRYGIDITGWYLENDHKCNKCGCMLAIFGRLERAAKQNRYSRFRYHR